MKPELLEKELRKMPKEELIDLVLYTVGLYVGSLKDLPVVYCPVCGSDLRKK
jgi:hypothetical protein